LSWNNTSRWDENGFEHNIKANKWRFGIISDMDQNSKVQSEGDVYWKSIFKKGTLKRDVETGTYSVEWDTKVVRYEF
jgi:hypothetical protein